MEIGDRAADVLLPAKAEHVQFGSVRLEDCAVRADPMEPNRGILEEVGKFLLAAPQFVFGGLSLDELAEASSQCPHHFQQVSVRFMDIFRKEFDDTEDLVADNDGGGKSAVQAVGVGRGQAREVA